MFTHYYSSPSFFYSDDPSSDEPDMKFVSAGAALYRRRLEKGQQNKTDWWRSQLLAESRKAAAEWLSLRTVANTLLCFDRK